ncbi:MAG: spore coat protein [Bacilli bacterium]|nr:spore coat protein [Bacilli bacterium]
MQQTYQEVPTMISCKDLDYLSDIYNWNFNTSKLANHFANEVTDEEIKTLLEKVAEVHKEHVKAILNILQ